MQGPKPASQYHFSAQTQSLKPTSQTWSSRHTSNITSMRKHRVWGSRFNTTAAPKHGAQSPRLSTTSILRHKAWSPRQSLKPVSQAWSSRRTSNTMSMKKHRVGGSCFNTTVTPKMRSSRVASSVTSTAKRRAQTRVPTREEPCVSVITPCVNKAYELKLCFQMVSHVPYFMSGLM